MSQHHRPVAASNFVARWICRDVLTRGAWSLCVVTYLEFHDKTIPRPWTSGLPHLKQSETVCPNRVTPWIVFTNCPAFHHYRVNKPFHYEILSRSKYSAQHTLEVCLSLEARDQLYRSYIKAEESKFLCIVSLETYIKWATTIVSQMSKSAHIWRNTGRVCSEHACFLKAFFCDFTRLSDLNIVFSAVQTVVKKVRIYFYFYFLKYFQMEKSFKQALFHSNLLHRTFSFYFIFKETCMKLDCERPADWSSSCAAPEWNSFSEFRVVYQNRILSKRVQLCAGVHPAPIISSFNARNTYKCPYFF
jgi:hypothetical protein